MEIPKANGQVERLNQMLISLFTKLAASKPDEWYKYLEFVQQYLNSTVHQSRHRHITVSLPLWNTPATQRSSRRPRISQKGIMDNNI